MLIVDTFSRKVWLEKMRTKGALQTARALQNVCNKTEIMPSVIMSDNGTEFKGEFADFCKDGLPRAVQTAAAALRRSI